MECKVVTEIPLLVQKIFQHTEAFVWIRPCTDMPFYKNIKIVVLSNTALEVHLRQLNHCDEV